MSPLALAVLAMTAVLLWPGRASAGDEVDYSAPYLTLEDGKLVTRYPAKPHEQAAEAQTGESPPADPPQGREHPPWVLAAAAALGFAAIAAGVRRFRRRS